MPYCDNQSVRVHYHVEGDPTGPPLVVHHGFSMSLEDWHDLEYVAALGDGYRLVLVDARGHGHSDKPHAAAAFRKARVGGRMRSCEMPPTGAYNSIAAPRMTWPLRLMACAKESSLAASCAGASKTMSKKARRAPPFVRRSSN